MLVQGDRIPTEQLSYSHRVSRLVSQGRVVIVQADTEFGTVEFLNAVRKRSWRAVVGMRCNRKMVDGQTLKQLYRTGKRGLKNNWLAKTGLRNLLGAGSNVSDSYHFCLKSYGSRLLERFKSTGNLRMT